MSSQAALLGAWSSKSATPSQPYNCHETGYIHEISQQDEISMQPLKVIMR